MYRHSIEWKSVQDKRRVLIGLWIASSEIFSDLSDIPALLIDLATVGINFQSCYHNGY
jgi:hypothetical protein